MGRPRVEGDPQAGEPEREGLCNGLTGIGDLDQTWQVERETEEDNGACGRRVEKAEDRYATCVESDAGRPSWLRIRRRR